MAFGKFLILRRSRSGRLEGRTTPIQPIIDFLTAPFGRVTNGESDSQRLNTYSIEVFCMSFSEGVLFNRSLVCALPPISTATYCLPLTA
jgi:hypothetical protein